MSFIDFITFFVRKVESLVEYIFCILCRWQDENPLTTPLSGVIMRLFDISVFS